MMNELQQISGINLHLFRFEDFGKMRHQFGIFSFGEKLKEKQNTRFHLINRFIGKGNSQYFAINKFIFIKM
ncbi:MAG: hypothetical protein BWY27_00285 [Bacteroidetes bacterium ADurb.Bin234]|nr:MAG: hypothetical protein BWY27_00285 [Bacteroidetes bacterium ADurb.Bin234]